LGAIPEAVGTRFRLYAPDAQEVTLEIKIPGKEDLLLAMTPGAEGVFERYAEGIGPGSRYRYRVGGTLYPDPASRFQPEGVHGPSEVVDADAFAWRHSDWKGRPLEQMVIYELHVGTFTPEGTYEAVASRLKYLRDLGVNTIELMPVHDFAGERNWGYDSAALYAPSRKYGRPDDLRRLVDMAHGLGLAVILDVVYNHLGPDGAYLAAFDRTLLNHNSRTPWGPSLNLDGQRSRPVREFLIQNALYWQREFRVDGFRLDATHALQDASETHFLEELGTRLREAAGERQCILIAEDGRNLNHLLQSRGDGGYGLDGEWCMDLHHQYHRSLTDERHVYYAGFRASAHDLAVALKQGWVFTGQVDPYVQEARGTDPAGIPPWRFVSYLQSHDEIGNRPLGDRIHAIAGLPAYRAAMALLLSSPQTPMLFMGDEWGASTPFLFFTDHKPAIGSKVAHGRQEFFSNWAGFNGDGGRERLPDPQSPKTFEASRLDWSELERDPHLSTLRYVRRLLAMRAAEPALRSGIDPFDVHPVGRRAVAMMRRALGARPITVIASLTEAVTVMVPAPLIGRSSKWQMLFTSEDVDFTADPMTPGITWGNQGLEIRFKRPGAVVLRGVGG
jgi:maltooligosyltrehalose trehalohydrolase